MYNCGIVYINDLLNDRGKFMYYEQLKAKYNLNIDFIYYMGIIDAIPGKWRRTLHDNHSFAEIDKNEDPHIIINSQNKNIKMVKSKDIYIELLQESKLFPHALHLGIKGWTLISHWKTGNTFLIYQKQ